MELTKKEGDAKAVLASAMKESKKKKTYICDSIEYEVVIEPGEASMKVKKIVVEAEEDEEQDGAE